MNQFVQTIVTALLLSGAAAGQLQAQTVTFEDVEVKPGNGEAASLPARYHGLIWDGFWQTSSWAVAANESMFFEGAEAHGGKQYAFSNNGVNLSITGGVFSVDNLWVREGRAGNIYQLTFVGLRDGQQKFTKTLPISDQYKKIDLNYSDIDTLNITMKNSVNLLLDDITFSKIVPSPDAAP